MMKTTFKWLTTVVLLCISLAIQAQPDWQWGKRGGSGGSSPGDKVVDMATDQNGNVYVLSVCSGPGTVDVDGHPGITPYDRMSVASWSCDGDFRWVKMFGSGSTLVTGEAIHVDTLGGVYITGIMSSSASSIGGLGYFDTDTVLPENNKRMYVIKYDTGGNYQWLKMPQPDTFTVGGSYSLILDMDGTPNGDLYLYTLLIPSLYDDGAIVVTDTGMYIWKMNKDGVFQSLTRLDVTVSGTSSNRYGYDNLVRASFKRDHGSGRFYLAYQYRPSSGNLIIGTTPVTSSNSVAYLAAFSKTGSAHWVIQSDPYLGAYPVVTDEHGNVYVSGSGLPGNFNGNNFVNSLSGAQIAFVMATDSNGNNLWGTNNGSVNYTGSFGLVYVNNTIATAGRYGGAFEWQGHTLTSPMGTGYIYLARFNATTGAIIGLDSLATGGLNNSSSSLTADKNGNFYVGGIFDAAITVAGNTLYKTGGPSDWFVAKFGTASCDCVIPSATFSYAASGAAINFSYTGSTDYTSISWDFGDGTTATTANPTHTFSDTGVHTVCVTVVNDCGSNVYCLEVAAPTGIESTSNAAAVQVYPNPANSSITVEGAGSGTKLMLYEVTGKLTLEQTLRNSRPVNLNISHLPDGVYLLQFTDSKGRKGMTKVVKR